MASSRKVVWSPGVYHKLRHASSRDAKSAKLLIICTVAIDRHGVPHRMKTLTAYKQRLDLLKITRDILNPSAHQADLMGVLLP
jgi:hypothetical protein